MKGTYKGIAPLIDRIIMVWIRTVPVEEAQGEVKGVYDDIRAAFGRPSPAFIAMSLNPGYLKAMWSLHSTVMAEGQLTRLEKEAIALSVSALNSCSYCIWAHSRRLKAMGMAGDVVEQLVQDPSQASLEGRLGAIVQWSLRATEEAVGMSEEDLETLRSWGLEDEAILEAAAVAGHFNHLNRVLDALGVEPPA